MAVKYRTVFNLILQSLAGVLVSLSANYKVATWITRSFSPFFFQILLPLSFPLSPPLFLQIFCEG